MIDIFESDEDFSAGIEAIHEINPDISAVKALRNDGGKCYFGPNVIKICQMADVVFLGLHGADGEGGKVQAAFDLLGIRYTGTDFVSGALAMDKCLAKELFMQNGIPHPSRLPPEKRSGAGRRPAAEVPLRGKGKLLVVRASAFPSCRKKRTIRQHSMMHFYMETRSL